jgi:predicted transcriptional regulator
VPADGLPALIGAVNAALVSLTAAPGDEDPPRPSAAAVRKSIRPDGLMSFIDGKRYTMLKRHLTIQGMTPDEYRQRFGLPNDYPMTAPAYSAQRSALAKKIGLGTKGRKPAKARPTRG